MTTVPPSDEQRRWVGGLFNKRASFRDQRPHSPCRTCYADCVSDSTDEVITFTCRNGHTHTAMRVAGISHGVFLAKYSTVPDKNV